jgi:hypothetical protein
VIKTKEMATIAKIAMYGKYNFIRQSKVDRHKANTDEIRT